ncbi:MAG: hypothetical protein LBH06_05865 [Rikenellaceae bacterium]|jgi:hypothetical protein|nr:hypothetical protein [Rikenellaceae bacterium]
MVNTKTIAQAALACLLLSCSANENVENALADNLTKADGTTDVAKNVVITDYAVNDAWPWISGGRGRGRGDMYVIRSLDDFYSCFKTQESAPTEIDFAKYSLVLVEGRANYGIASITKELPDIDNGKWLFRVNLALVDTYEAPLWRTAALTPALPVNADVTLSVSTSDW